MKIKIWNAEIDDTDMFVAVILSMIAGISTSASGTPFCWGVFAAFAGAFAYSEWKWGGIFRKSDPSLLEIPPKNKKP